MNSRKVAQTTARQSKRVRGQIGDKWILENCFCESIQSDSELSGVPYEIMEGDLFTPTNLYLSLGNDNGFSPETTAVYRDLQKQLNAHPRNGTQGTGTNRGQIFPQNIHRRGAVFPQPTHTLPTDNSS